jgi:hypothetical protein
MVRAPDDAVPFLKQALPPVPAPDADKVSRRIADLDDRRFAVRDRAMRELEKLGELATPALRQALDGRPSVEKRQRLERLLARQGRWTPTWARLRTVRAVTVLEYIGSAEARQVLEAASRGAEGARLTREARAALGRLKR